MKNNQKIPVANQPKLSDRRVKCTHTTMKRVFDLDGTLTCPRCGSLPCFGWVYACTVDEHGYVESEQAIGSSTVSKKSDFLQPAPSDTILSDSVTKAVGQGHYTDEQVGILLAQRASVVEMARAQTFPGTGDPAIVNKRSAEATLMEPKATSTRPIVKWITRSTPIQNTVAQESPSDTTLKCRLMVCHFCHPASRDRAWLSLNKYCSSTAEPEVPFNIFDIPASAISRMPLPSAQKTTTYNDNSEAVQSIGDYDAQLKDSPASPESLVGSEDTADDNKGSVLHRQKMLAFEARLQTSQHWSHVGLHESLARQNVALQPGWMRDPPKRTTSAGRPSLVRRPKWTMDVKHQGQESIIRDAGL